MKHGHNSIQCLILAVLASWLVCLAARAKEPLPELRDLKLKDWDCLEKSEGRARDPTDASRNRQKNRAWVTVVPAINAQWDFPQFVAKAKSFDAQLNAQRRRELSPAQATLLASMEKQIVSLTGWVVLTYPGPPESCNCGSAEFHDWHVEMLPKPLDHQPGVGDPTPIICEVTPRTETALYKAGVRLQKLAAFMRLGEPPEELKFHPTGTKPHKVRITGYLMWDDAHNQPQEIGSTIQRIVPSGFVEPWRATAWEIHPILKIEDLGTAP